MDNVLLSRRIYNLNYCRLPHVYLENEMRILSYTFGIYICVAFWLVSGCEGVIRPEPLFFSLTHVSGYHLFWNEQNSGMLIFRNQEDMTQYQGSILFDVYVDIDYDTYFVISHFSGAGDDIDLPKKKELSRIERVANTISLYYDYEPPDGEELDTEYSSMDIIQVIKSERFRWDDIIEIVVYYNETEIIREAVDFSISQAEQNCSMADCGAVAIGNGTPIPPSTPEVPNQVYQCLSMSDEKVDATLYHYTNHDDDLSTLTLAVTNRFQQPVDSIEFRANHWKRVSPAAQERYVGRQSVYDVEWFEPQQVSRQEVFLFKPQSGGFGPDESEIFTLVVRDFDPNAAILLQARFGSQVSNLQLRPSYGGCKSISVTPVPILTPPPFALIEPCWSASDGDLTIEMLGYIDGGEYDPSGLRYRVIKLGEQDVDYVAFGISDSWTPFFPDDDMWSPSLLGNYKVTWTDDKNEPGFPSIKFEKTFDDFSRGRLDVFWFGVYDFDPNVALKVAGKSGDKLTVFEFVLADTECQYGLTGTLTPTPTDTPLPTMTPIPSTVTPMPTISPTPIALENGWYRYTNTEWKFSISYPSGSTVTLRKMNQWNYNFDMMTIYVPLSHSSYPNHRAPLHIRLFDNSQNLKLEQFIHNLYQDVYSMPAKYYTPSPTDMGEILEGAYRPDVPSDLLMEPIRIAGQSGYQTDFLGDTQDLQVTISNGDKVYTFGAGSVLGPPNDPETITLFYEIMDTLLLLP